MGIFSRSNKVASDPNSASVIASGTKIVGELKVENRLFIDGEIDGSIISDSIISIGKSGKVIGDVQAQKLIIGGIFEGVVECDECEILCEGKLFGEVTSATLVIESGGLLEGASRTKAPALPNFDALNVKMPQELIDYDAPAKQPINEKLAKQTV